MCVILILVEVRHEIKCALYVCDRYKARPRCDSRVR